MTLRFKSRIEQALNEREHSGLTRRLQLLDRSAQGELIQQDRTYLNFSSNDYLGLANDAELVQAWQIRSGALWRRQWRFADGNWF